MTFSDRLLELIAGKHITKNKLMTDLNYNKSSVLNWTQRGNIPSGDILQTLADYFNVSVDYLLGGDDNKKRPIADKGNKPNANDDFLTRKIVELFEKLQTEEDRQLAVTLIERLSNKSDKVKK